MNEVLDAILTWVEGIDPVLRILVTGLAVMLETSILVGLIVPGDTIVLVSSTGVTTIITYLFTVLAAVLGALVGESIGFSLGSSVRTTAEIQLVGSPCGRATVGKS
jgi:membrane protein DedA with SNARE-associated domain